MATAKGIAGYLTAAQRWDQNGRKRTKEEKLARNKAIAEMGSALYDGEHGADGELGEGSCD